MNSHTSVAISYPAPRSLASSLLNAAGLRATPARIEILVALATTIVPLGPVELVEVLSERGVELIQARRSLADLHKAGILEPVGDGGQFQLTPSASTQIPLIA